MPLIAALSLCLVAQPAAIMPSACDPAWAQQAISHSFDYALDIQPIWDQYCANCHVAHAGQPLAGLDLNAPFSFNNLWFQPDTTLSIYLVQPYAPEDSLLFRKINCSQPGPLSHSASMPLGRPALPAVLQARVYDWIKAGAPLLQERFFASGLEAREALLPVRRGP